MASTTGIELGSESCVLVGVRPVRAGTGDVLALHTIGPAEWPVNDASLAEVLGSVRRGKRLPRRAVVVAWGLPDDTVDDATEEHRTTQIRHASTRAALGPIEAAGFRIGSVLTPPQALARLAGTRPRQDSAAAVVWLALNMHGVAIAIVRSSELLFSRTFPWKYNPNLTEAKAQLLQRYSLIAHLAPEVRQGIAVVRASHGASVDAVVTCGDLPELRSLTMPLIEELDLEVETLDSADGLRAARNIRPERLMEAAPAIRLAAAAALTSAGTPFASTPIGTMTVREEPSAMRLATAAVALIAALVWGMYSYGNVLTSSPVKPVHAQLRSAFAPPQTSAKAESKPSAPPSTTTSELKGAPQASAVKDESEPVSTVLSVRSGRKPESAASPLNAPSTSVPAGPPPMVVPTPAVPSSPDQVELPDMRSGILPSAANLTPGTRYVPLKEPLPQVDSILIDQERRLAIVEGVVVGVGDAVGPRRVVHIESDVVDFREPSGLIVRVHLRPKLPK